MLTASMKMTHYAYSKFLGKVIWAWARHWIDKNILLHTVWVILMQNNWCTIKFMRFTRLALSNIFNIPKLLNSICYFNNYKIVKSQLSSLIYYIRCVRQQSRKFSNYKSFIIYRSFTWLFVYLDGQFS